MIEFELLRDRSILIVKPKGPLEAGDFLQLASAVDPFILQTGDLKGLLIDAPSFPGWDSFAGFIQHVRFVRDHHRRIRRVAAVTDSAFVKILPRIAEHFANPEIRVFDAAERSRALAWLEGREQ
jgi:hypothetical protein